jgi:hypothetical protein
MPNSLWRGSVFSEADAGKRRPGFCKRWPFEVAVRGTHALIPALIPEAARKARYSFEGYRPVSQIYQIHIAGEAIQS